MSEECWAQKRLDLATFFPCSTTPGLFSVPPMRSLPLLIAAGHLWGSAFELQKARMPHFCYNAGNRLNTASIANLKLLSQLDLINVYATLLFAYHRPRLSTLFIATFSLGDICQKKHLIAVLGMTKVPLLYSFKSEPRLNNWHESIQYNVQHFDGSLLQLPI